MIDPHVRRTIARQTDDLMTKDGLGPTGMDGLAAAYPKQGSGWAATRAQPCGSLPNGWTGTHGTGIRKGTITQ